jgi:flagellar assembly protein FliH
MTSGENAISRWDAPAVAGKTVQGRRAGRTVSELEDVDRRTQQEAYAKGHAAGLAAARAESQQALNQLKTQVANIDKMLGDISQPFKDLDSQVEEQLVQLSLTIARQLVRRELRMDPAAYICIPKTRTSFAKSSRLPVPTEPGRLSKIR